MTTLNSSGQCQKRTRPLNFGIRQAKNEWKLSMSLHVTDLVSCTKPHLFSPAEHRFFCVFSWLPFHVRYMCRPGRRHPQAGQYKKHTKEYTVRI